MSRLTGMADRSTDARPMLEESRPVRWPVWLAMGFLACLVIALFHPVGDFEFLNLDVPDQVAANVYIRGLTAENLQRIFTSWCMTSYYPIRTVTFAIDYQIWGSGPGGFKCTNVLIHLANVWLVFWLMLRLFRVSGQEEAPRGRRWEASVAAFSAGIFAIHPVVVEPVTWVAGREELLMVLGALGCIHCHITARRLGDEGAGARKVFGFHAGAALCCAVACLSNAVAAVIPALIAAWDVLMLRPLKWRRVVLGTSALWVIGAATIVLKKLGDTTDPNTPELGVLTVQRLMVVLNVYWLNLKTLFWPSHLAIDYWNVAPAGLAEAGVILGFAALVLTCLVMWLSRRRKHTLFGLAWFVLALGPTAQIMPHHLDRADRFLYLPLVGLLVAAALEIRSLRHALKWRFAVAGLTAAGALGLLLLGDRAAGQIQTWRDSIAVWENCVRAVPTNAFAHRCLAECLSDDGRFSEAIPHFRESLRIDPNNPETLGMLANRLATCRQRELRDYPWAVRLAREACRLTEGKETSLRRTLAVAHMNLATDQKGNAQFDTAIENYRKAVEADSDYEVPLFNLASILANCPEERRRRPDEAVELAERACEMLGEPKPFQWTILAEVYAHSGRLDRAVATTEKAIRGAQAAGDLETSRQLHKRMQGYQDRIGAETADSGSTRSDP